MELADCPVKAMVDVVGGKWKPLILHNIKDGVKRFNELHRLIPSATQKMLTLQLRELEGEGIVHRRVYAQVPPRVDYSLTEYGATLRPILKLMCDWGAKHKLRNVPKNKTARKASSPRRDVSLKQT